ncbi:membrane-bound lysozyme-inhibitor of c-type lysozyme family protein [Hydrogenophaga sp. RAC07]|uniref:MliC family protein n=1 Tax=Hydrogenophaga sp. RAC07 TaxID=1842537 RepID=UPI00083E4CC1|nr:MliC family protein [Hydrogenophaga sp. RAC07]AOF85980.1 membrane-bound lysozyme-inhibitor of c-type lysozyme family protein [Hydrogenophaga sp. RAC07]
MLLKFIPRALGSLLTVLSFTVAAQGMPPAAAPATPSLVFSSQAVNYRCDGGTEIELVYLNLSNGNAFAALHFNGRTVMLQGRRATTGVRFIALDEQNSLRWYTQGMKGELRFLAADHTAQEQTLLADCFAQPAKR